MALSIQTQLKRPTITYVEGKVQGYLVAASISATAWAIGDVIQQLFKAFVFTIWSFTGLITAAVRGGYLDTALDSTDEGGDPDGPNWLSDLGGGMYSTEREGATFASGLVTFTNGAVVPRTITAGLTVQNANPSSPAYKKTYRVQDDGTLPWILSASGGSRDFTVRADEIGTGSNSAASEVTTLVDVSLVLGVTVSNPSSILGSDTEDPDVYRERCREAQAASSPNGPEDAYLYLARTLPGGKPLPRIADGVPVNITRMQVIASTPVGTIDVYYADDDGGADDSTGGDVETANANILQYADPVTDTFNGYAATNTTINVTYTAKLSSKKAPGVQDTDAEDLIEAALQAYFKTTVVGGDDQDDTGAGFLYTEDLRGTIMSALFGLYDVDVSTPGSSSTAIAVGHVAVLGSISATVTVV